MYSKARFLANRIAMNEIELLRRHIEDIAAPSSEFVGRTRGHLLLVIEESDDGVESATRTAVQVGAAPKTRHRSFRVLLGAAAAVAALVIALLVSLVVVPTGTPGGPAKSAAAELRLFASQAGNVATLAPGQYFYSALEIPVTEFGVRITPTSTINEYQNTTWQVWVNGDGNGRAVQTIDPTLHFFSAADRAAWVAAGSPASSFPPSPSPRTLVISPNSPDLSAGPASIMDASNLPTDPSSLEKVLASGRFSGQLRFPQLCQTETCAVVAGAASLLQGPDIGVTPALRSALFEVLARVPGMTNLGNVTDKGGQSGIGLIFSQTTPAHVTTYHCVSGALQLYTDAGPVVSVPWPASTTSLEFVIDPDTTAVIGTQEITTPDTQSIPNSCPGAPQKQETYSYPPIWTNVLSQGVVHSTTSTSLVAPGG
jgi:hypothetical protein